MRRVPVNAEITLGSIAAQEHFAEILKFWIGRVCEVSNCGGDNLGISRSGEGQKLLDLVAGDVAQHAAIPVALEEPRGPKPSVEPVRTKAYGLNNAADGAGLHQLDRTGHCAYFEPL